MMILVNACFAELIKDWELAIKDLESRVGGIGESPECVLPMPIIAITESVSVDESLFTYQCHRYGHR